MPMTTRANSDANHIMRMMLSAKAAILKSFKPKKKTQQLCSTRHPIISRKFILANLTRPIIGCGRAGLRRNAQPTTNAFSTPLFPSIVKRGRKKGWKKRVKVTLPHKKHYYQHYEVESRNFGKWEEDDNFIFVATSRKRRRTTMENEQQLNDNASTRNLETEYQTENGRTTSCLPESESMKNLPPCPPLQPAPARHKKISQDHFTFGWGRMEIQTCPLIEVLNIATQTTPPPSPLAIAEIVNQATTELSTATATQTTPPPLAEIVNQAASELSTTTATQTTPPPPAEVVSKAPTELLTTTATSATQTTLPSSPVIPSEIVNKAPTELSTTIATQTTPVVPLPPPPEIDCMESEFREVSPVDKPTTPLVLNLPPSEIVHNMETDLQVLSTISTQITPPPPATPAESPTNPQVVLVLSNKTTQTAPSSSTSFPKLENLSSSKSDEQLGKSTPAKAWATGLASDSPSENNTLESKSSAAEPKMLRIQNAKHLEWYQQGINNMIRIKNLLDVKIPNKNGYMTSVRGLADGLQTELNRRLQTSLENQWNKPTATSKQSGELGTESNPIWV